MRRTRSEDRPPADDDPLLSRVRRLRLHGLLANWEEVKNNPWVAELCTYEETARQRLSLERRLGAGAVISRGCGGYVRRSGISRARLA